RVWVESLRLTRVTLGAVILTVWLLVPLTLYCATCVAPVHVRLALAQLKAPAREIPTVAPDQMPGTSAIVPRLSFCSRVRISGFTTFAFTCATCVAACAPPAPARAPMRRS